MCQCWCGWSGCSNPVPLHEGLPFHRDSSPACCNTRHTLAVLTATTSASSIMNVNRRYPSNGFSRVGVGIMIAHNPLHGSGRAGFPHPALALGDDAHAAQRIGMTDGRRRQPASDEAPHTVPTNVAVLAAPRQRAVPEPSHLQSKKSQRRLVHGHSVVAKVSTHNRPQPLALPGGRFVHASLKLGFHLVHFRLQPFPNRLPQHREPSIAPLLHADMPKAEKVESLRFPFTTSLPSIDRIGTELQQARFLGMQFQVELPHSFGKFRPELIGIRLAVKSNHDVVSKSHDDDIAVRPLPTPRLDPQVEHVMEINVSQKRRCTSALGRPFLHPYPFPILQHASVEPFLDQAHNAPICRVRWWRGSGLRMMPTFPPPPLSFRTAGFPQYGWKVGLAGSAFPHVAQVKPAPGVPCASRRFASALRAPRCLTLRSALCRNSEIGSTPPCEELSPLPQRPSLRSGFYCPSPSPLTRPHPPHSRAHPDFPAWRVIRDAFAVLVRLGDPRVVPCFRCTFLLDMPPSKTAGSPLAVCAQFLRQRRWPSPGSQRLGTPQCPIIRFRWDEPFAASLVRTSLRPVELLAPLADPTGYFSQPTGTFTPELSASRSPFSSSGITTVATEQVPPTGLSPAGTSASIAAHDPCPMIPALRGHGTCRRKSAARKKTWSSIPSGPPPGVDTCGAGNVAPAKTPTSKPHAGHGPPPRAAPRRTIYETAGIA